jgi:hypothetical protein
LALCEENGDCCNFNFGTTSTGTNSKGTFHFNQTFSNGKNYPIQQLFAITGTGFTKVPGQCEQTH